MLGKKCLNILVVEDELLTQQVHTKMLQRLGYTVDITGQGKRVIVLSAQNLRCASTRYRVAGYIRGANS